MLTTSTDGTLRNISDAIRKARSSIFNNCRTSYNDEDRPEVSDVIVLFIGGLSSNAKASKIEAELAKYAGIKIVTVGIGSNVDVNELKVIATNATEA